MNTIGKRIKKYRELKGLSQADLANLCGWGASRIGNYERDARKVNSKTAETIAKILDITPSNLMFGTTDETKFEYAGKVQSELIIVIGEAIMNDTGVFEINEDVKGYLKFHSNDSDAFALLIKGDSMFPRINSGEFVVIEPNIPPQAGDEVLVTTKSGKNMIKKLEYYRNGVYRFNNINNINQPITIENNLIESVLFLGAIVKFNRYIKIS